MSESLYSVTVPSPVGNWLLVSDGEGVTELTRVSGSRRPRAGSRGGKLPACLVAAQEQVRAYFAGELRHFELTLNPAGTVFQKRVWQALQAIPYATTSSYAELARRIGNPTAVRAVGGANGRNPIAIIVPCHRVIGADGSLTGYAGGLELKQSLLRHEADVLAGSDVLRPSAKGNAP